MPWTKSGDTAASYPRLLAVDELEDADDWSLNEVAGFVLRLYFHSAGHMTDYEVGYGDIKLMGNGRHEHLQALACRAGLMRLAGGEGRSRRWVLVDDPEFVHVRRRDEVLWDRQRDKDRKNPDLTMPVRLRDGDSCRYCGQVVSWADRKSGRAGTYDHRDPGSPATVDTYVVACKSCNSARLNDPDADAHHPLRPAPTHPHYSPKTRTMLEAYYGPEKVTARLSDPHTDPAAPTQRPATQAGTAAPARPAKDPAPDPAANARPARQATTRSSTDQTRIPDPRGGTRDGSGRDGPGQVRKGRGATPAPRASPSPAKTRRRRGRRSRPPRKEGTP